MSIYGGYRDPHGGVVWGVYQLHGRFHLEIPPGAWLRIEGPFERGDLFGAEQLGEKRESGSALQHCATGDGVCHLGCL